MVGVGLASNFASPLPIIPQVWFAREAEQKAENRLLRSLAILPVNFWYEVRYYIVVSFSTNFRLVFA
jgi:hypothetical protein